MNQETAVEEEVPYEPEELTEYTEAEYDDGVTEEEGELSAATANSVMKTFNWTIAKKTRKLTPGFSATAGKGIAVAVSNPSGASVRVGISKPGGTRTYVTSSGTLISHTFSVSVTGTYKVFVQNMSNSQISVSGSYWVV